MILRTTTIFTQSLRSMIRMAEQDALLKIWKRRHNCFELYSEYDFHVNWNWFRNILDAVVGSSPRSSFCNRLRNMRKCNQIGQQSLHYATPQSRGKVNHKGPRSSSVRSHTAQAQGSNLWLVSVAKLILIHTGGSAEHRKKAVNEATQ